MNKTFIYIAMGFMALSLIAHGYADALPAYTTWLTDTATTATALAGLFLHPPTQ